LLIANFWKKANKVGVKADLIDKMATFDNKGNEE